MTTERRMTSRQAQAIRTRNKILKTAIDMMSKKGFDNITVQGISKSAGVSVGSFYYYFNSKEDILTDIFHRADDYFHKNVEKFQLETAADSIIEFFSHYAKYINSNGIDFAKKLYNTENKTFINHDRAMYQIFFTIIKNGQENGEITRAMTTEEICNYLFIAARGVVFEWCLHDGKYSLESAMVDYLRRLIPIFKQ